MLREFWRLLRSGIDAYIHDQALTRGAAIAFYIVTAIAPLMYICVTIAGLVVGRAQARDAVGAVLGRMMSHDSVAVFESAIRNAPGMSTGILGGIIGVVTLILTASGVFGEMEDALNQIWRVPPKGALLPRLLRGRARSLALVMGLGVLLAMSMLITAGLEAIKHTLTVETVVTDFSLSALNVGVSFLLATLLFAAIYKVLPNKDLEWRDVIAGAAGTALLFEVGQFLLGWFFTSSAIARPYGAAGGLMVLLLWVYYSAQVFLLGAEFTRVYACRFGSQQQDCDGIAGAAATPS